MSIQSYSDFLRRKAIVDPPTGIDVSIDLPSAMMPHQRDITEWSLRRGRAAIFAGTGLGKTFMELAWADRVAEHTGKPVLVFAPLAVSAQHIREASKFGLSAEICSSQDAIGSHPVIVTNYQKMDRFDLSQFGGVVLDESSILKNTDGKYRTRLIEECRQIPFRLAATATPAPNDFMELGNHAEFLGVMSQTDMLAMFFTHDGGETQKWRLKGHAEDAFWRWMASWSVMLRKPSDLGYPDDGYNLPPLKQQQHSVQVDYAPCMEAGTLFPMEARTMGERLAARRDSVADRVELALDIVVSSFLEKLTKCHGSQNTQRKGAQNTKQMKRSAAEEGRNVEPLSKMPHTCANITSEIQENPSERLNSKRKSTVGGVSDTLLTQNIESSASKQQKNGLHQPAEKGGLNQNTGWTQLNMTPLLRSKKVDAQYVGISQDTVFTLITAMKAGKSEGFFAAHAIPALDILKTTQNGLTEPWCIWCNLNSEQDALAKAFGPLAYSVTGSMPDDQKEAAIFDWIDGKRPVMISKPAIMGFGMNFQHCRNTIFVGLSDSFEQVYQAIRRFWRFGQTKPVNVHFIAAETEGAVVSNIRRKEADAERMADAMVKHMADLSSANVRGMVRDRADYSPSITMQLPAWAMGETA